MIMIFEMSFFSFPAMFKCFNGHVSADELVKFVFYPSTKSVGNV
jgi:hypothetical protein